MVAKPDTPAFSPRIDPEIWRLRPDFVALSLSVRHGANGPSPDWARERLAIACAGIQAGPNWASAHLASWQDAYRAFGAKPQRTPSSAEALRRRGASLPSINAVVDIYNVISIAYAVPVGGEDIDAYAGNPLLTLAKGDEPFETVKDGAAAIEHPEPGEVVWRDEKGVTCRRWNWRQGPRTRITEASRHMWFVIERLEPMPMEMLLKAGDELAQGLKKLAPDATVETQLLQC